MTAELPALCQACARWSGRTSCEAFPDGIPGRILRLGADHTSPVDGDHGLQFVQADGPDARQAFEDWRSTFGTAASARS